MELRARITSLILAAAFVTLPLVATAASYDEAVNGDISGARLTPTALSLDPGSNPISGTTVSGDLDYLTVNVPAGYQWSQLVLTAINSIDNLAFIAIQAGTQFTEPANGTNVANLLGYTHIVLTNPPGDDYLFLMSVQGAGSIGYTPPLPAGDYTLWIQQTGLELTGYTFDAVVTAPEPGSLALFALALAGLCAARARRVT